MIDKQPAKNKRTKKEVYKFLESSDADTQKIDVQKIMKNNESTNEPTNDLNLQEAVTTVLKDIYDPEIPVNIYDLGLIYDLSVDQEGQVAINMTLTSPMCPVAQTFPQTVQDRVLQVEGVTGVTVELVWEPPWTKDMMSEAAQLQLNLL